MEGKRSQGLSVEETVRIFVRSAQGVIGNIDLSWSLNKELDRYISIYGSRGTEDPKGAVYVGAGVGAAIVPLRLGERAKREVAFFELGTQPGAFDEHHGEQEAHAGRIPSEKTKERRAQAVRRKQQKRERRNGNGNNAGFNS